MRRGGRGEKGGREAWAPRGGGGPSGPLRVPMGTSTAPQRRGSRSAGGRRGAAALRPPRRAPAPPCHLGVPSRARPSPMPCRLSSHRKRPRRDSTGRSVPSEALILTLSRAPLQCRRRGVRGAAAAGPDREGGRDRGARGGGGKGEEIKALLPSLSVSIVVL